MQLAPALLGLQVAVKGGRDRLVAAWPSLSLNVPGIAGLGLLAYGAHEIYHPAGWIVLGLELVGGSFLTAVARGREATKAPPE